MKPSAEDDEDFSNRVRSMKDYIRLGKDARERIINKEGSWKRDEKQIKIAVFSFLLEDANRVLKELLLELKMDDETVDVKELSRRRKDLPSIEQKVENLATKYTEMLIYSIIKRQR